jgi:hypothetical protein
VITTFYIKSAHIKNISSYDSLEITWMILLVVIFQDKYKDLDSRYVEGKTENIQKNKEFKYVQGCEVLAEGKVCPT